MLKPSHLLTQGFGENMTAQENIFKPMRNFGAREEWREGRRVDSYYLNVDTAKDKCHLLNHTPLEYITDYIMEDAVGDRDFKRLPQRSLKFIGGYIPSYCSILNSPKRLSPLE